MTRKWKVIVKVGVIIMGVLGVVLCNWGNMYNTESNENELDSDLWNYEINIEKINHKRFKGEIKEVKSIIINQIQAYQPYMNSYPRQYTKEFNSIEECMEYVGVETEYYYVDKNSPALLIVLGNERGEILQLTIISEFEFENQKANIVYNIFSDLFEESCAFLMSEMVDGDLLEEGIVEYNFQDECIVLQSEKFEYEGFQFDIEELNTGKEIPVFVSRPNSNNIASAESWFSEGEIVYNIRMYSEFQEYLNIDQTYRNMLSILNKCL